MLMDGEDKHELQTTNLKKFSLSFSRREMSPSTINYFFNFFFRTMSAFKQYVQNMEGRQSLNQLLMYLEIEQYNAILPAKKMQKTQQATHIYK